MSASRGLLLAGLALAGAVHAGDCVRSEPAPMFGPHAAGIHAHAFRTLNEHEADERLRLADGVDVMVRHGGCEYVVATLRFSGAAVDPANPYAAAAARLRALARLRPQLPLDLDAAAATLAALARRHPLPPRDSEHVVGPGGDMPLGVKLDAAGRHGATGYVQVTLFLGPL